MKDEAFGPSRSDFFWSDRHEGICILPMSSIRPCWKSMKPAVKLPLLQPLYREHKKCQRYPRFSGLTIHFWPYFCTSLPIQYSFWERSPTPATRDVTTTQARKETYHAIQENNIDSVFVLGFDNYCNTAYAVPAVTGYSDCAGEIAWSRQNSIMANKGYKNHP